MDDLTRALNRLSDHIADTTANDPIDGLAAIGVTEAVLAEHRRDAVRLAAVEHSWSEIGEALGVSRQAAHQRYAKEWATELKTELKGEAVALKGALKTQDYAQAADHKARLDAIIEEFAAARRANRRRRS